MKTKTFILVWFIGLWVGLAQAQIPEYERKAAMIAVLANYVRWPEDALKENAPLVIGILGNNPFGETILKEAFRLRFGGKKQVIINHSTSVASLQGCHIMIICNSERNDIVRIIKEIDSYKQPAVLTIGDEISNFCEAGGIISFLGGGSTAFDLNMTKATYSRLLISTQIINAARIIR